MNKVKSTSLCLSLIASSVAAAYAQEAEQDGNSNTAFEIEKIQVTAQKRVENLQEVPISLSSLSDEFLQENDVRTLEDLNGVIPGLSTTNSVGYGAAPISIRGIGGANGGGNFFNDEPVGVYIDGVYVGRLSFSTADLLDIESIQVLRGPQGTLYGRNSTAGAILVTTNKASDSTEGQVNLRLAEFGERRASASLSGALSDSVSARLSVGHANRDGFGNNVFDGTNIGQSRDNTARLSLNYQMSETTEFNLIAEHQQREANPALIAMTDLGDNGVASPFVLRTDFEQVLDNNEFSLNDQNLSDSTTNSITLLATTDLGWATFDSITGYRDWDFVGTQDSDSTGLELFSNNGDLGAEQISQEFRLSSNDDGPLSWIVGAFYFHEDVTMDFNIRNFQGLFGLGTEAIFDAEQSTEAYALFANTTYEFTDKLSATFGIRYSYEEKEFSNNQVVEILNGGTVPDIPPAGPLAGMTLPPGFTFLAPPLFEDTADFNDIAPRVVVNYAYSDDIMMYANYSEGFKSGGFNSFGLAPAFNEELLTAYEVGIKSDLMDRRLRINGSLFTYDYEDLQIRLPVPTGGVDIQNIGEAAVEGVELETTYLITPDLSFTANISWLDTEILEGEMPAVATDTPPFPIGIPLSLTTENVAGNSLTRAPDIQAFANLTYEVDLDDYYLTFSGNYRYQDASFFLETNQDSDTFRNDSWNEVDVRITLASADDNWEVALFGQNLTDNRVVTAVTALGGFPNATLNEPRKFGIDFLYRWQD